MSERSWLQPKVIAATFLLIAVAGVAHGLYYAPALFMDDWTSVVERVVTGNAKWLDVAHRRPLLFSPLLLQHRMFGLNIAAYYVVLCWLYALLALLLYRIAIRMPVVHRHMFGLVAALLFLVYPTNYTHMWLIMLGVHCAVGLTLGYAYLLLRYAEGGGGPFLLFAAVCLLISLGIYEAQIGVACAWALVLYFMYRHTGVGRRLALLSPIGVVGFFALWRTFGYQLVGVGDRYLSQMDFTPQSMLSRMLLGYKITLARGVSKMGHAKIVCPTWGSFTVLMDIEPIVRTGWMPTG